MDYDKVSITDADEIETKGTIKHIFDIADEQKNDKSAYYPTRLDVFDQVIKGGIRLGDLVVISAPTGHGKTTFAQTLAYHFVKQAFPCIWFNYEMTIEELCEKFKATGVTKDDLIYSVDKLMFNSVDWIEERIKDGYCQYSTGIVFIDHLGYLLPKEDPKFKLMSNENMANRLTLICRQLKILALQLNIAVFLVSHMRKTDKPNINDLSGSAGIGQEADLVFVLERLKSRDKKDLLESYVYNGKTRITLDKNRRTGISKSVIYKLENGLFVPNIEK